jgi:hypothetical protein
MTEAPAVLPAVDPFGPGPTTTGKSAAGPSIMGSFAATQSATGRTGGRDRAACSPTGGPAAQESCGAVTAEFAVTLPAVLLLLAMLLAGASAGVTQLRLEEGARAGARALARGDDSATVERIVRTLAGGSASAAVSADGEWLHVTVTDRVGGPLGASIPWHLTARASTRSETAG